MRTTFRQLSLQQVRSLAIALIRETMGEEQHEIAAAAWKPHRPGGPTRSWGLWLNGKFAGFVGLGSEVRPGAVWLGWFAVSPAFQRQGWGTYLLARIEKLAVKAGYSAIYVETYRAPQFVAAQHFYSSEGYRSAGFLRKAMTSGMTALYYYKNL